MSKRNEDYAALVAPAAYNVNAKAAFAAVARKYLRRLAKELALPQGSYTVRYNPGGTAVSGDVILHAERLYVWVEQRPFQDRAHGLVLYRGCRGRKDYSGLVNHYADAEVLLDTPRLAALCREVTRLAEYDAGLGKAA
ncbi:MAG TPA: hypothetical protein VFQ88_15170 [Nevskiaceae bacterium]|nr:hypothetical protein [Nevskiaceae bacterium]